VSQRDISETTPESRVRAVLFDLDDTLFDRWKAQDLILEEIVREQSQLFHGLEFSTIRKAFAEADRIACEEYDAGIPVGDIRDRRSRLFLELLGLPTTSAKTVTDLYLTRYPTLKAPVEGALSLIPTLAEQYDLGIITNGFRDVQHRKIETLGIACYFRCIVLPDDAGAQKPDPRIFRHAASSLRVNPASCLYVGDLYLHDIVGAKRAGMLACWFNPRGEARTDPDIMPDAEIKDLMSLGRVLKQLNPPPTRP